MFKISPSQQNLKCGLLNQLYHKTSANNPLYDIPINRHNEQHDLQKLYSVIDCNTLSEWASNVSDPSFKIQLYKHRILTTHISLTRRNSADYPKKAVLEAFDLSGWIKICDAEFDFTKSSEVGVRECKSSRYFTAFRFRQIENSQINGIDWKYIEFDSFDLFGTMKSDFVNCFTHSQSNYFKVISFLFFSIFI